MGGLSSNNQHRSLPHAASEPYPPVIWHQRISRLAYPTPFLRSISQASKQKEYGVWDLWFSIVVDKTCSGLQERGLVQFKNSSIQCKLS